MTIFQRILELLPYRRGAGPSQAELSQGLADILAGLVPSGSYDINIGFEPLRPWHRMGYGRPSRIAMVVGSASRESEKQVKRIMAIAAQITRRRPTECVRFKSHDGRSLETASECSPQSNEAAARAVRRLQRLVHLALRRGITRISTKLDRDAMSAHEVILAETRASIFDPE